MKTGSYACFQSASSNWTLHIDFAVLRCIRHRVQGRQHDGIMGTNRVGGDGGERTHSSEERNPCACLAVVSGGS